MSDTPRDPTDQRDDAVAARLAVDPLDEVTRTRLVRTAMAASDPSTTAPGAGAPSHRSRVRWLAVAAALLVVVAVGVAVFAGNDSESNPTASRAPKAAPAPVSEKANGAAGAEPSLELGTTDATGSPALLGPLGEVDTPARLRTAVRAATPAPAADNTLAPRRTAESSAACAGRELAKIGRVVAVGTGTVNGDPVVVYVLERKDGGRVAVTVAGACTVGEPVSV